MRIAKTILLTSAIAAIGWSQMAMAADDNAADADAAAKDESIIVTGAQTQTFAGTKTDTPIIETPQPITVVTSETYLAQGAISISDTLNYVAGATANPYGRDTRVDGTTIRGVDAVQFRDGMQDIQSYYASIVADPYNFSRIEVVRGPASVLFGQGSIGGIVNLVSKTPDFSRSGEVQLVYGSYDRKEVLADVQTPIGDQLAVRLVARVRDSDTQTDYVNDNRVMIAPSIRWRPTDTTDITLIGLYQEDDGGSTAQFLPIVGTLIPNPGQRPLPFSTFVGKPGWDRYDGRSLQGTAQVVQKISDKVQVSLKARYIDSDLTYFTHYANSYGNPPQPWLDADGNSQVGGQYINLFSDGSYATMNIFSTDNNVQAKFNTGKSVEHTLLAGVDYSWYTVTKRYGGGIDFVNLYDIDYDALTIPEISDEKSRETRRQLGFYLQDQIRVWDRVSMVFGVRHDNVYVPQGADSDATTFRAGIIGELGWGISPFFSYTESFQPQSGYKADQSPLTPLTGRQYEIGIKWQPDSKTLLTITGFDIAENGRPIDDPSTVDPNDRRQAGKLTTRGVEFELTRTLPGDFELIANYAYNKVKVPTAPDFSFMPQHNASIWATKTFKMNESTSLRLGGGVRYTADRSSLGLVTPSYTLVDALAEISYDNWRFKLNATNLLGEEYYSSCLSRGDCFLGVNRNIMASVGYRF